MDERTLQPGPAEVRPPGPLGETGGPGPLGDPRALTILTTEHWSLLSARSLVYNEAFARGGMFLAFLSATLVALSLAATAIGVTDRLLMVAAVLLAVDLFVGLATLGRVVDASAEDIRCLQGMNRLRHAYHELVPGLEPYFVTSRHDDLRGVFAMYGAPTEMHRSSGVLHGLTTTPGMLSVVCAVVAGSLVGVLLAIATHDAVIVGCGALVALIAFMAWSVRLMQSGIRRLVATMEVRFPSPPDPVSPAGSVRG